MGLAIGIELGTTNSCAAISANIQTTVQSALAPELGGPAHLLSTVERSVRRTMLLGAVLGVLWAAAFWLGYYLVHR